MKALRTIALDLQLIAEAIVTFEFAHRVRPHI